MTHSLDGIGAIQWREMSLPLLECLPDISLSFFGCLQWCNASSQCGAFNSDFHSVPEEEKLMDAAQQRIKNAAQQNTEDAYTLMKSHTSGATRERNMGWC